MNFALNNLLQRYPYGGQNDGSGGMSNILTNTAAFMGAEALLRGEHHHNQNNGNPEEHNMWKDVGMAGLLAYGLHKYQENQARQNLAAQQQQLYYMQQQPSMFQPQMQMTPPYQAMNPSMYNPYAQQNPYYSNNQIQPTYYSNSPFPSYPSYSPYQSYQSYPSYPPYSPYSSYPQNPYAPRMGINRYYM